MPDPSPADGDTEQADRPLPPDAVLRALHQTGILLLDRDGTYRQAWIAPDIEETYGLTEEALRGKQIGDFFPIEKADEIRGILQSVFDAGAQGRVLLPTPLGKETGWQDVTFAPLRDDAGAVVAAACHARDVTGHRREADRLRALLDSLQSTVVLVIDHDGVNQEAWVSADFRQSHGLNRETFVGKHFSGFYPADIAAGVRSLLEDVVHNGSCGRVLLPNPPAFGEGWHDACYGPLRDSMGAVQGMVVVARDATEECVRRDRMEAIFAALHESAVQILDRDGVCLDFWICPKLQERYEVDPKARVGMRLEEWMPESMAPTLLERIRRIIDTDTPDRLTIPIPRPPGGWQDISASPLRDSLGRVSAVALFIRDISEQRNAQEALIRSERLAAVGTLAAGVAHEYNNIHTSMVGFLQLALQDRTVAAETRHCIERALKAARRASGITRNLLDFARREGGDHQPVDLAEIVAESRGLADREFTAHGVTVLADLQAAPADGDPTQLGQVALNLMLNAAHAVSGRQAREVSITTGVEEDRTFLRVADTGCGIASDARERLFLPFFSTKGEHAQQDSPQSGICGTGLGLAVCQTIAHAHDGVIEVESEPEHGAVFTLFLPRRAPGA